jgi:hypothetical protein
MISDMAFWSDTQGWNISDGVPVGLLRTETLAMAFDGSIECYKVMRIRHCV